jgi:hypothetical protein
MAQVAAKPDSLRPVASQVVSIRSEGLSEAPVNESSEVDAAGGLRKKIFVQHPHEMKTTW